MLQSKLYIFVLKNMHRKNYMKKFKYKNANHFIHIVCVFSESI